MFRNVKTKIPGSESTIDDGKMFLLVTKLQMVAQMNKPEQMHKSTYNICLCTLPYCLIYTYLPYFFFSMFIMYRTLLVFFP